MNIDRATNPHPTDFAYIPSYRCTHNLVQTLLRITDSFVQLNISSYFMWHSVQFCRCSLIVIICNSIVPCADFRQRTFGHARQVKVTTTYSTAIHRNRRYPNRSAFRTGTVKCWTRLWMIMSSVITRHVLISASFYCISHSYSHWVFPAVFL